MSNQSNSVIRYWKLDNGTKILDKNNSSINGICKIKSRTHLASLYNKHRGFKINKYNNSFAQNTGINITTVLHKIQEYIRNFLRYTNRMTGNELPGIVKNCRPTGRRDQWRPLKRILDM